MASSDFNPATTPAGRSPTVEHPVFRSSPLRVQTTGVLVDEAAYSLGTPDDPTGFYRCWDAADLTDAAEFCIDTDGVVTLVVPIWTGSTWVAADTDDQLCFYVSSGEYFVKNRSGGPLLLNFAKLM